jgi:hypothetical protein
MAFVSWAVVRDTLKELIQRLRETASSLAGWLDDLPEVLTHRLNQWLNAYNRTYAFMLDPQDRREVIDHGDEPISKSLMRFLVILARQSQAVSMAIRAINGIA